jgi:hypothetical protein
MATVRTEGDVYRGNHAGYYRAISSRISLGKGHVKIQQAAGIALKKTDGIAAFRHHIYVEGTRIVGLEKKEQKEGTEGRKMCY